MPLTHLIACQPGIWIAEADAVDEGNSNLVPLQLDLADCAFNRTALCGIGYESPPQSIFSVALGHTAATRFLNSRAISLISGRAKAKNPSTSAFERNPVLSISKGTPSNTG